MNTEPTGPNDYSRNERQEISWWSSRRGRGTHQDNSLRRNRRITMIDMLLLVVMAGVLVPWFLSMDRGTELGAYLIELDISERRNDYLIKLVVSLDKDSEESLDDSVGWSFYDGEDKLVHEERDLPPQPGDSRVFRYLAEKELPDSLEILVGDEKLIISPVE